MKIKGSKDSRGRWGHPLRHSDSAARGVEGPRADTARVWSMPVDLPEYFGYINFNTYNCWKDGRAVEGGGLENRYTVLNGIEGSNPSPSAMCNYKIIMKH